MKNGKVRKSIQRLARPCKKCERMFIPKGKCTRVCDNCKGILKK